MFSRIRNTFLSCIFLVSVIRGTIVVELDNRHLPNLILVRVDNTTWDCYSTVADVFPGETIDLIEYNETTQQSSFELENDGVPIEREDALLVIYDPFDDAVLKTHRRFLRIPNATLTELPPTIRILSLPLTCSEYDKKAKIRLIRDANVQLESHEESMSILTSEMEHLEVDVYNFQPEDTDILEASISLRIFPDFIQLSPSSANPTTDRLYSQDNVGTLTLSKSSNVHRKKFELFQTTEDGLGQGTEENFSSFLSRSSIGVSTRNSIDKASDNTITLSAMAAPRSSTVGEDCSVLFDECCSDLDCTTSGNICVARTCIDEGMPRFTLSWNGDDDLDLYVVTPSGFILSYRNQFDEASGGRVGEPIEQNTDGYHVENIYFPLTGGPSGTYEFYVRPLTTVGTGDTWTMTVDDENGQVLEYTGEKFSPIYQYIRSEAPTTGSPTKSPVRIPTVAPVSVSVSPTGAPFVVSDCDSLVDECCFDSDCRLQGDEVCFNRNCIDDGNPRITLSWIGNDDLDLFVETPAGNELSFMNFFDAISGGRFGEDVEQSGSGFHVENVYFPETGAPAGNYRFFVRPVSVVGDDDQWTLTVVDRGVTMMSESGSGSSVKFYYSREREEQEPTSAPSNVFGVPSVSPILPTMPTSDSPVSIPTFAPIFLGPTRAPLSVPAGLPTRAPQTDDECNTFFDECCDSTDCRTSRDICEQRTCIRDGNPRFSLIWDGDDNLDLFVITPDGIEISESSSFDIFSGGRFEMDSDQDILGKHVENVYFPVLGTPIGLFSYGVKSGSTAISDDNWVLEVYDDGQLVASHAGTGAPSQFEYVRDETLEGPQRPLPSPPRCSPLSAECCLNTDCAVDGDICVQRKCIAEGSPRITLRWIGDDDLNLVVQTPTGSTLSSQIPFDSLSGGLHEQDSDQSEYGFHVESVVFPDASAFSGSYTYSVQSATTRGVGADVWRVTVYEQGEEVDEQTGIGESRDFTYERLTGIDVPAPVAPSPTSAPFATAPCSTSTSECCSDSHCANGEICENRSCVNDGNPRVTLSWVGDDDFDLFVRTPGGETIFYNNRVDTETGGIFEGEAVQEDFNFHVENIYFPASNNVMGEYAAVVRVASRRETADVWTLRFYDNGVQQISRTGTGDSGFVSYDRTSNVPSLTPVPSLAPVADPSPTVLSPITERPPTGESPIASRDCEDECCSDSDCTLPGEFCVQRTCIAEGTPRFTLTWTGNDNLSLAVVTPGGKTISNLNPIDDDSGGLFGEDAAQNEFGFHVENIIFPTRGGPEGDYSYFVKSDATVGVSDRWALRVYVDGTLVAWRTGTGESRTFVYSYGTNFTTPTSSPSAAGTPVAQPSLATRVPAAVPSTEFCTLDSDCLVTTEVCIQETCISDGNPRFTVIWTGNDDLDLYVQTPNGDIISATSPFDELSGGIFGEPGEQTSFDRHVENIYFPIGGGLPGTYSYYIRSARIQGSNDTWEASVAVDGVIQETRTGAGDSEIFLFDFTSQFPTAVPLTLECTSTSECSTDEVCVQETCIDTGNPRITMTWTGDDDLDLFVITPLGETISYSNPFAALSVGYFGEEGIQTTFGKHVENVYFPETGPSGNYLYFVRSYRLQGSADLWNVTIVVDGEPLSSQSGSGSSDTFTFSFNEITSPTASPSGGPCDPTVDECCIDSDCIGTDVCAQRTCINEGNPRFTLTWTGDDDLDLVVVTPIGTFVSYLNDFDAESGGRFGESGDQFEFGQHVENIFFPTERAPLGTYQYYVRSFLPKNEADTWTVCAFVNGQESDCSTATGSSAMLTFEFSGAPPTSPPAQVQPTTPTPAPVPVPTPAPVCDVNEEECCTDSQCITGVETCVQFTCIDLGTPRFTLTWTGDDDLDLKVQTPLGTTVSFDEPLDESTGGVYGESGSQFAFGNHVENIYFQDGAPLGVYTYSVESFFQRSGNDAWTITVYVNNQVVASQTGISDSTEFTYDYQGSQATTAPIGSERNCDSATEECCADTDCNTDLELCVQRTCINQGSPRFTLTWNGDDDVDLTVVSPFGTTISVSSVEDELSLGIFGETGDQLAYGQHVENIYFPLSGGPAGTYTYFVSIFDQVGTADTWTVSVYVDDALVTTHSGVGDSDFLVFDYDEGFTLPPTASTEEARMASPTTIMTLIACNTDIEECCSDDDCPTNSLCVQRTCIEEGNPRFTVTWNGDNQYNLTVTPPIGNAVSYLNPIDTYSGGRFDGDDLQSFAGLHVENVFFPTNGGPIGTYQYSLQSYDVVDYADTWTITVYVNGEPVDTTTGTGNSDSMTFDYALGSTVQSRTIHSCSLDQDECCTDSDCINDDTSEYSYSCIQRTCIPEGNPSIILTWTGDDDLDLTVYTPQGTEISYYHQNDDITGAIFKQDGAVAKRTSSMSSYAPHLESVIFPDVNSGTDSGRYKYKVSSFNTVGGRDHWVVQIMVNGTEVISRKGQGDSVLFGYEQ